MRKFKSELEAAGQKLATIDFNSVESEPRSSNHEKTTPPAPKRQKTSSLGNLVQKHVGSVYERYRICEEACERIINKFGRLKNPTLFLKKYLDLIDSSGF